jgi:metal-responsive CopG/Arc/MetJ family transcriptional regulator
MPAKKIGISLPEDLLKEIDKYAAIDDRSRSNFICTVLRKAIEDRKKEEDQE